MTTFLIIGCGWFAWFVSLIYLIWTLLSDYSEPKKYRNKVLVSVSIFAVLLVSMSLFTFPQVQVVSRLSSGEDSADESPNRKFEPADHAK